ncbi:hypothetical protein F1643_14765 [Azospirillum sp. INR13]|uniref:hypothetical protein n=1 Tax=Azospirillum sp. INR13 TaxID=2596919 RepID=UPI0018925565|nr:hypothetical protein [Azospirillum sp. INR13]MBF5095500.1 hypothetical protein [Azospirillum sp. INR13]
MASEAHLSDAEWRLISEEPVQGLVDLYALLERKYLTNATPSSVGLAASYLEGYLDEHADIIRVDPPKENLPSSKDKFLQDAKMAIARVMARQKARLAAEKRGADVEVILPKGYKEKIREMIASIRTVIDQADINVMRKEDIKKRLSAFAEEVERDIARPERVGRIWLSLTAYVGEGFKIWNPRYGWLSA